MTTIIDLALRTIVFAFCSAEKIGKVEIFPLGPQLGNVLLPPPALGAHHVDGRGRGGALGALSLKRKKLSFFSNFVTSYFISVVEKKQATRNQVETVKTNDL